MKNVIRLLKQILRNQVVILRYIHEVMPSLTSTEVAIYKDTYEAASESDSLLRELHNETS